MNGELICVGTELLLGDILNTNAQYLSRALAALGIDVYHQSVVGDNTGRLREAFREALGRSDLIILTGGLGPTQDDLTKECVASVLGLPLLPHEESLRQIEAYFARTGRKMTENNKKQALCPRGAEPIQNDVGTAPGYRIAHGRQTIVLLPGPPYEMQTMFETYVKPFLQSLSGAALVSSNVQVFGLGEAAMEEMVKGFLAASNPTVAPYAKDGEASLRVTAKAGTEAEARALCEQVVAQLKDTLGDTVYGVDTEGLNHVVVELLRLQNLTVATAESCTGGLLSEALTAVPGASAVFAGGVSAYSAKIKRDWLGVSGALLEAKGTVDPAVAAQMAQSVRECAESSLGIGITGVAGPDSVEGKPIGLVYIALADQSNVWVRKVMTGHGKDRDKIRNYAVLTALDLIRRYGLAKGNLPGGTKQNEPVSVLEAQPPLPAPNDSAPHAKQPASVPLAPPPVAPISDQELFTMIQQNALEDPQTDESFFAPEQGLYSFEAEESLAEGTHKAKTKRPFLAKLIPWRGDSVKEIIFKVIFWIALITLIVSSAYIISYFYTGSQQTALLEEAQALYASGMQVNGTDYDENGINEGMKSLLSQNEDFKAWISIPQTKVNYPVYQSDDNEYYMNHNMNRDKTRYGSLFLDYRCTLEKSLISQNLVVYGHNLNDGSMFGSLKQYKTLSYYQDHPNIQFNTIYRNGTYKIFSVFIINADEADDNGARFPFESTAFADQAHFLAFVEEAKERSLYQIPVDVTENDEILTLVTCTYEFDDARLVLMARRVRQGESAAVASEEAVLNPNPRYPQAWYDKRGIQNPFAGAKTFPDFDPVSSEDSTSSQMSEVASSSDTSSGLSSVGANATVSPSPPTGTVTPPTGTVTPPTGTSTPPATTSTPPATTSTPPATTSTPPASSEQTGTTSSPPPPSSSTVETNSSVPTDSSESTTSPQSEPEEGSQSDTAASETTTN